MTHKKLTPEQMKERNIKMGRWKWGESPKFGPAKDPYQGYTQTKNQNQLGQDTSAVASAVVAIFVVSFFVVLAVIASSS